MWSSVAAMPVPPACSAVTGLFSFREADGGRPRRGAGANNPGGDVIRRGKYNQLFMAAPSDWRPLRQQSPSLRIRTRWDATDRHRGDDCKEMKACKWAKCDEVGTSVAKVFPEANLGSCRNARTVQLHRLSQKASTVTDAATSASPRPPKTGDYQCYVPAASVRITLARRWSR